MPAASATPLDLQIAPRDLRFLREDMPGRWWHGGDPFATAFYNALSSVFPQAETFVVQSVRQFAHDAPPKLAAEIKGFTAQEAIHSREHIWFNKAALEAGFNLKPLEERLAARIIALRRECPETPLAATMALEHFTAIFAHEMLSEPDHLEGVDPRIAALWQWHCIEEIEHKAVSYDCWLHATRDWSRFRRWRVKSLVMLRTTREFIGDRTRDSLELLRQDGITGPWAWARIGWFMWIKPGMMRKIFGAWAKYFLPGFHPWNSDDRHLIVRHQAALSLAQVSERKVRSSIEMGK